MSNKTDHHSRHICDNSQYEKNLLGIILSDNSYADVIIPYLLAEDFATLEHKELFIVMSALYDLNISINDQQILSKAKALGFDKVREGLLANIYSNSGLPSNIQLYIRELIRLTKIRTLRSKLAKIDNDLYNSNSADPDEIISQIQSAIMEIDRGQDGEDFLSAKTVSDEFSNELSQLRDKDPSAISGVPTGYTALDELTQGLQDDAMIVIAARPGLGKTALALNIAVNVAQQKKPNNKRNRRVAFFSLEMSPKQLMGRIYSIATSIDQYKLKKPQLLTDNDMLKISNKKVNVIDKMNLFIDNTYENELQTLLWKCRRLNKVEPLDLIVVDYMQLIHSNKKGGSENRQMEITRISRSLKTLALELHVPIIVLSQLNRQTELRENKRPNLADLRESGSIENDADIVMFLYRDSYYNKETTKDNLSGTNYGDETEIIVAKHRSGATADLKVYFHRNIGKFTNYVVDGMPEDINNFKTKDLDS
ncbi:DNA helicase [Mycoplasmopsis californica]|uniref:DNA 5'-3' helicase n=1 Tax=Mycoplasmopsis californica TaxID=2113 RepID=A0A059XRD4_9BACT|nr:replicative DNA helicase [Mycoplasmopsis californica]AIA29338.1 DNA helicase [Mycoplasmopsis californica]